MHVRFVVNILGTKNCTQSALKPHNKSPETRINAEFPSSIFLLKLGVFFIVINCICLSFMQIHTDFYSNYIIYFALLIFCCQDVATPEPYTILSPVQSLTQN